MCKFTDWYESESGKSAKKIAAHRLYIGQYAGGAQDVDDFLQDGLMSFWERSSNDPSLFNHTPSWIGTNLFWYGKNHKFLSREKRGHSTNAGPSLLESEKGDEFGFIYNDAIRTNTRKTDAADLRTDIQIAIRKTIDDLRDVIPNADKVVKAFCMAQTVNAHDKKHFWQQEMDRNHYFRWGILIKACLAKHLEDYS